MTDDKNGNDIPKVVDLKGKPIKKPDYNETMQEMVNGWREMNGLPPQKFKRKTEEEQQRDFEDFCERTGYNRPTYKIEKDTSGLIHAQFTDGDNGRCGITEQDDAVAIWVGDGMNYFCFHDRSQIDRFIEVLRKMQEIDSSWG